MGTNGSAVGCGTKDEFGCAIITTAYVGDVGFSLNQHLGTIYVCLKKNMDSGMGCYNTGRRTQINVTFQNHTT